MLIAGPTASGKSALAMEIAARDGGMIVNADALQVYANWGVLSARPTPEDEARLPHRLYGHIAPDHAYSVGEWLREVARLMPDARQVIVGSTGLYLSALTEELAEIPPVPPEVRTQAEALRLGGGAAAILRHRDPPTPVRLVTDPKRQR